MTGRRNKSGSRRQEDQFRARAGGVGPPVSVASGAPSGPRVLRPRALCPDPADGLPAVIVKGSSGYPNIYRKRLGKVDAAARPGDLVAVYSAEQELLGYGLYNPRSEIAVRVVREGPELPDEAFFDGRLRSAVSLRRELLKLDDATDAYRLIHAESDGFSGLVIDRLGDVLSVEAFSLGMYVRAEEIVQRLAAMCGTKHFIVRPGPAFVSQEGYEAPVIASEGLPATVTVREHGSRFRVRFAGGHKTGFFCDQRENRRLLAGFCGGGSVLDLCCYSGGFAIQAKRLGGAAEVTGVDLDEEPLALARENANLNQVRVAFVQADIFAYMRDMLRAGRQYDVVVLDPPKLIRSREEIEEGRRKHFDMNRLAVQLVRPGGLLLSCSCSGLLSEEEFLRLLFAAARQAGTGPTGAAVDAPSSRRGGRNVQVLMKTGAAADHPVSARCPETEYLKAVWMRVE
ncbi:MAG: class I SAM-dependent rRNA methyltransferase [Planctomycetia bacterium]|nr:class I SAM-dependent rRNA methyltransferase [Planctomycetia bacterium]